MLGSESMLSPDHLSFQGFPIVDTNPWIVVSVVLSYLIGVFYFSSFWPFAGSRSWKISEISESGIEKNYGTTPLLLTLNGMNFGLTTVGFVVVSYMSGFGRATWKCSTLTDSLLDSSIKYAAYVYFLSSIADCSRPVIMICSGHSRNAPYHAVHATILMLFTYSFLRYDLNTVAMFFPYLDSIVSSFRNAYFILIDAAPSKEGHQTLRKIIIILQFLQSIALMTHSMYLLFVTKCVKISILIQLAFSTLGFAYNISKMISLPKAVDMKRTKKTN